MFDFKWFLYIWVLFAVLFLLWIRQASAKQFITPGGAIVDVPVQEWRMIKKEYTLPSGRIWEEFLLIPQVKAEELSLTFKEKIIAYLSFVTDKYGVNIKDMDKLITCESGYDIDAKGDYKNKVPMANGILQFWKGTFEAFKKEAKMPNLKYENWYNQLELGSWAISRGYQNHWKWCWWNMVLGIKWPK